MAHKWRIGNDLVESDRDLIEVWSGEHTVEEVRATRKHSRTSGVPGEIQTDDLRHIGLERHRYSNPLSKRR
jgi:hypothetical protein